MRARERDAPFAIAGCAFALAIALDSSYVVFLLLAPISIGRASPRRYATFAIGACVVLAPLVASDLALSGNVRPPDTNARLYDYPGSPFAHGYVIGSIGRRSLADVGRYAFDVTFGERGLFSYSPILLVAAYGLVRGPRSSPPLVRRILRFASVATLLYVAVVIAGTTDLGGGADGLRRFVGIELLMCLSLGAIWDRIRARPRTRALFLGIYGLSLAITGLGVRDPLVLGPFPARDAIPILVAYARTNAFAAAVHVLLVGALATAAYAFVRSALRRDGDVFPSPASRPLGMTVP